MPSFSHLHTHTQYSMLDGASSIERLYKKAIADKMPAIAITDHGNLYGAFEFVAQAYKHQNADKSLKVKPIVGCEFYLVDNRHIKHFSKDQKDKRYHQLMLAKNEIGYANLIKLSSLGFTEGSYGKYPRIDKELIKQYHEGLIATSCCLAASIPQTILTQGEAAAEIELKWWLDIFGSDFYLEIQRHQLTDQNTVNEVLVKFSKKYNVSLIASNDSHYIDQQDAESHDILLCINTGSKKSTLGYDDFVDDEGTHKDRRFKFPNNQFYFKTTAEMELLFSDLPQAIDNTNEIVSKVDTLNLQKNILLPNFPLPPHFQTSADNALNQWNYLHHLSLQGAAKRYGSLTPELQERLDFELFTIKTMGFAGYFLIVADFIEAGKALNVFVGPGRGSAAGSMVAYCIGITNIDPIKYNLLFERFLNPDRKELPDIDTDFDDEGRQKVIDYVIEKYGKNQVAQIITFGTMAARSSIKDVARVLDLPLHESNALSQLVPARAGTELKRILHAPLTKKDGPDSLEEVEGMQTNNFAAIEKLRTLYAGKDLQAEVLQCAERLEGSVRNRGIHAAGIVITPKPITDILPVCTSKDSELLVTQISGDVIEKAGVLKMDFLGLKTLSILKTVLALLKTQANIDIDLDTLPLDDPKTFQLYQKGETNGTFQFESPGMQKYLQELQPDNFTDLIAMNALYRPGPMAYIPNYINRKQGRQSISYDIPAMEEILKETYGITIYQEQVMLLSQKLGGFSKSDADVLRKAMGKKQKATLDQMKTRFLAGATQKGYPAAILEKIWTDWEAFAQYAFNKSHSTCYALLAYQTAYLKANYPAYYMAALLTHHTSTSEQIIFYIQECQRMGIKVLGPDMNEGQKNFSVNAKGEIRFGLLAIKGIGEAVVDAIMNERSKGLYTSPFQLALRLPVRAISKKSIESLAYSGAFDCFDQYHRAQYFAPTNNKQIGIDLILDFSAKSKQQNQHDSPNLFGNTEHQYVAEPVLPTIEPWSLAEQLQHEKNSTGMYISGHPLDHFSFEMQHYHLMPVAEFNTHKENDMESIANKSILIAGLITSVVTKKTKTGKNFSELTLEDRMAQTKITIWNEAVLKFQHLLTPQNIVYIQGAFKQRYNGSAYEFSIFNIQPLDLLKEQLTKKISVALPLSKIDAELVQFLQHYRINNPGLCGLQLVVTNNPHPPLELLSNEKGITLQNELVQYLSKKEILFSIN